MQRTTIELVRLTLGWLAALTPWMSGCGSEMTSSDMLDAPTELLQRSADESATTVHPELSFRGSGCPAGSVKMQASADGLSLRLAYYALSVYADGSTAPTSTANCEVTIQLRPDEPAALAVRSLSYEGEAVIHPGFSGHHTLSYVLQGSRERRYAMKASFRNEGDLYELSHEVDEERLAWSTCGREHRLAMVHDLEVGVQDASRLQPDDAPFGAIGLSAIEQPYYSQIELVARRCIPPFVPGGPADAGAAPASATR